MPATGIRRSDRVCLTLLLEVTGTDRDGKPFVEPAHTLLINRHGAVIVANHVFRADQVLHVRRTAKHESHRTRDRAIRPAGRIFPLRNQMR